MISKVHAQFVHGLFLSGYPISYRTLHINRRIQPMPSTYAHYLFGQEVYRELPAQLQTIIDHHRSLYHIGLHGPDIFFYYFIFLFSNNASFLEKFCLPFLSGPSAFTKISSPSDTTSSVFSTRFSAS